ncbi:Hypothetical protein A7982_11141 [Minicystis rosea]|nr:Hypothetical protein A7982_11141 [Minicystis rosea]
MFAASCLCFAPGQVVSGVLLLVAAIALWRWDQKILLREADAAPEKRS